VDWALRLWCKTDAYWDVHQAGIRAVKYALDEAGIGIPFPQMDVYVHSVAADARREAEARSLS
jgi:small conductance mechanosensitive channel